MKDDLVLNNEKLIYHILKKMSLYNQRDTYYDLGLIGLVSAANTFDESKGYKFCTYAAMCIKNEILKVIIEENRDKRKSNQNTISLDQPISINGDGNELSMMDVLASDIDLEEELIKKEQKEALYKALTTLKEQEILIINYYYGLNGYDELSQQEIAKTMNLSQAQVSRIIKKSVDKLRKKVR